MRHLLPITATLVLLVPLVLGLAGTSWAQDNTNTFTFSFTATNADPNVEVTGSFAATRMGDPNGDNQAYELAELLSVEVDDMAVGGNLRKL